jgi:dolichyl-phosphate-mannose--protein O-mannosyl transferase
MVLSIVYVIAKALEDENKRKARRELAMVAIALIALCFAYFFPLYVGGVLNYDDWYARMWFTSWI